MNIYILLQQLINGLVQGAICAALACGINLIYAETRTLWFAYAAMPSLGGLIALSAVQLLGSMAPDLDGAVQALISVGIAATLSATLSWWLGAKAWQRLREQDVISTIAAAIATGIAITSIAVILWGRAPMPFPLLFPDDPIEFAGAITAQPQLAIVAGMASLLALIAVMTGRWKTSTATATVRPQVQRVGVAFALAGVLSAAAGMAHALNYSVVRAYPDMIVLTAMIAACIGGLGSFSGAIWASLMVGVVSAIGAAYMGELSNGLLDSHQQDLVPILLLVMFLVYRRQRPTADVPIRHKASFSPPHRRFAFDRPGQAYTLLAVLALVPVLSTTLEIRFPLRTLTLAIPAMAIVLGVTCMLGRTRTPAPGFMMYPLLGGYTYALLASEHLLPLIGPQLGAGLAMIPPWAALLAAPLASAGLATALHYTSADGPVEYGVVLSLAVYQAQAILVNTLDSPYNITNGPRGISPLNPLSADYAGTGLPLAAFYAGLLAIAAVIAGMTTLGQRRPLIDSGPGKRWHIRSAAIGGLAGGLTAAASGFMSPENFPSDLWLNAVAVIFLAGGGTVGRLLVVVLTVQLAQSYSPVLESLQLITFGGVVMPSEILWQLMTACAVLALTVFHRSHSTRLTQTDRVDALPSPS